MGVWMDQIVLAAVVRELGPLLAGRPFGDAVQIDSHRFLLRFEEPPFPRLHVCLHSKLSTFHPIRGERAPAVPTELAASLTRELAGRRVTGVEKPKGERLVRLLFGPERTLVIELMGRASNLLLLDGSGRILRFARTHKGAFRRPAEGEPYRPPSLPEGAPGPIDRPGFGSLVAGGTPGSVAAALVEGMPGLSLHLAREVEHRARAGEDPWEVFTSLTRRAEEGPLEPVLYAPAPPAELEAARPLDPRNLFAFVFPLEHAARLVATPAASAGEAEAAASAALLRHFSYASLRQSLSALLGEERRRCAALVKVLGEEEAEAVRAAPRDRRRAELILAGLRSARKEGDVVRVIDHYDPEAREVAIPIDARLDLRANAERFFHAARRAERALAIIPDRLARQTARLEALGTAASRLDAARSRADLETLERELQREGLVKALRPQQRADVGARPEYVKVREYRSTDGFTILVGRTGAENDTLTFKVAAPHDLWLHAAGYAGAHVVVRNPRRLGALPESTVLEAAALAAWFSRGRSDGQLDVHVAWRRHVRKGKGMSPGMVMMKRHRTVRVAPTAPRGSAGSH